MAAEANYNMSFDNDSFNRGKKYEYQWDAEKKLFYVKGELGVGQEFYLSEFNILFTLAGDE